jgi:hypothetical protein
LEFIWQIMGKAVGLYNYLKSNIMTILGFYSEKPGFFHATLKLNVQTD